MKTFPRVRCKTGPPLCSVKGNILGRIQAACHRNKQAESHNHADGRPYRVETLAKRRTALCRFRNNRYDEIQKYYNAYNKQSYAVKLEHRMQCLMERPGEINPGKIKARIVPSCLHAWLAGSDTGFKKRLSSVAGYSKDHIKRNVGQIRRLAWRVKQFPETGGWRGIAAARARLRHARARGHDQKQCEELENK